MPLEARSIDASVSFQIGDTVGDYRLVGLAGSGAVGRVFRVEHAVTGRIEAMKVLIENQNHTPEQQQRFLREVQVQARLNHPNIASVHNAFWANGDLVMVMEFVEGESLDALLRRGRPSLRQGIDLCCQALDALTYAHARGVTHRDIKPANIIVTPEGVVKLTDFGLAKTLSEPSLTQTGALLGSIAYMAPEQVRGREDLDAATDIYSCGVVLYELLTGTRPFDNANGFALMWAHVEQVPDPPQQRNPAIGRRLSALILKALAKDPRERFASAAEFRQALAASGAGVERADGDEAPVAASGQAAREAPGAAKAKRSHEANGWRRISWKLVLLAPALAAAMAILIWTAVPARQAIEGVARRTPRVRHESFEKMPAADRGSAPAGSNAASSPASKDPIGPSETFPLLATAPQQQARQQEQQPAENHGGVPGLDAWTAPPLARDARAGTPQTSATAVGAEVPRPPKGWDPPPGWTPPPLVRRASVIPVGSVVHSIALSGDGRWVAAGLSDHSIRVSDATSGATIVTLRGHSDRVAALAFSSDRTVLASGSWDGTAKLWRLADGRDIKTLGVRGSVSAVALSDDGSWLAAGATDKVVHLWDLQGDRGARELNGHKRSIQALAFSPDSQWLASAAPDERILLWPLASEAEPRRLPGPPHGATTLAFSPDGGLLASAGGGEVKVWDIGSASEAATTRMPGWLYSLAFDGGKWMSASALSDAPQTVELWRESGQLAAVPHGGTVRLLAWSHNGERLATAGEDGRVLIWELNSRLVASARAF